MRWIQGLLTAILLAAIMPGPAGCSTANRTDGLLDDELLPAFSDQSATPASEMAADRPAFTAVERDRWPAVTIRVPPAQTEHPPAYTTLLRLADATARQRGSFPAARTALQRSGDEQAQLVEALWGAPHTAIELLLIPFEKAFRARMPWSIERSPAEPYERAGPAALGGEDASTRGTSDAASSATHSTLEDD